MSTLAGRRRLVPLAVTPRMRATVVERPSSLSQWLQSVVSGPFLVFLVSSSGWDPATTAFSAINSDVSDAFKETLNFANGSDYCQLSWLFSTLGASPSKRDQRLAFDFLALLTAAQTPKDSSEGTVEPLVPDRIDDGIQHRVSIVQHFDGHQHTHVAHETLALRAKFVQQRHQEERQPAQDEQPSYHGDSVGHVEVLEERMESGYM